jgi:hypothetical protein
MSTAAAITAALTKTGLSFEDMPDRGSLQKKHPASSFVATLESLVATSEVFQDSIVARFEVKSVPGTVQVPF